MNMKRLLLHLLIVPIATAAAFAQDTIVFKNGDVLTGTILKQDAEHVQFKSGSFGPVTLDTADISETRIETPEPSEETAPAKTTIPAPKPTPKTPGKWTGQAGMAIAMREKNYSDATGIVSEEQFETYRLYGNLNWKGEKNELDWNWTYRYSEDEIRTRDDYLNITQKYNRSFKGAYYAEAKTVYQRDYNRRIDDEYLQTAEVGIRWIDRPPKIQFSTSAGGGYHQYKRGEISAKQPKFIFDESLRWKIVNSLTLFQKYTHLGDLENYHFVFTNGLENKLIRDVFLRLEYRLDRDTDTTYNDRGYYDKALLTSLLYKF